VELRKRFAGLAAPWPVRRRRRPRCAWTRSSLLQPGDGPTERGERVLRSWARDVRVPAKTGLSSSGVTVSSAGSWPRWSSSRCPRGWSRRSSTSTL